MRVRTDRGALVAQAVLSGVLTFVIVGDGSAAGDAAKTAPGMDGYVLRALLGGFAYVALFLACHLGLRNRSVGGRWAYAGIGAACALAAVAMQTPPAGWEVMLKRGVVAMYFAMTLGFGAIMGFLYNWRAGLEAEGDDPALLDAAVRGEATAQISDDGALVDTGQAEYFEGPLQVRTAAPLAFVAALISAGSFGLVRMAFGIPWEIEQQKVHAEPMPWDQALGQAAHAQLFNLPLAVLSALPFTALVLIGHLILRAMGKSSYAAYLVAGALLPFVAILFLGPMGALMGVMAVVPMAISMCVYRNMAGLEPKPVKEDIVFRDRRDLVGEGHVRRRFGRLVKG